MLYDILWIPVMGITVAVVILAIKLLDLNYRHPLRAEIISVILAILMIGVTYAFPGVTMRGKHCVDGGGFVFIVTLAAVITAIVGALMQGLRWLEERRDRNRA